MKYGSSVKIRPNCHCVLMRASFRLHHVLSNSSLPHLSSLSAPRRFLPILRGFPIKYIYDPWNAPEDVQKAAKCIIGVHYPKPMVNHAEASRLNIERMKQIYQQLSCYRGLGKDTHHTQMETFLT